MNGFYNSFHWYHMVKHGLIMFKIALWKPFSTVMSESKWNMQLITNNCVINPVILIMISVLIFFWVILTWIAFFPLKFLPWVISEINKQINRFETNNIYMYITEYNVLHTATICTRQVADGLWSIVDDWTSIYHTM